VTARPGSRLRSFYEKALRLPLSLRTKLLIGAALIALPGIFLAISGDLAVLRDRQAEVIQANIATATTVGRVVDASIDEATSVAFAVALAPTTQTLDPAVLDPELARYRGVFQQFTNVVVVNRQGASVGEMLPYRPGEPRVSAATDPAFVAAVATGRPQVGAIRPGERSHLVGTRVIVPVRNTGDQVIGAVIVALNLNYLNPRLAGITLADQRQIYVTDQFGNLAYSSAMSVSTETVANLANVPLIQAAGPNQIAVQTSGSFGTLGGNWLGVAMATPHYGWIVAVIQPVSVAFAPITQALALDAVALIAVLIFGTIGSIFVERRILAPIHALENAADAWGRGNLSERVTLRTGDEFDTLASTFNAMAASLARSLGQLQAAEHRLIQEDNRLRAILNTSPAGIIVINRAEEVILANSAVQSLVGQALASGRPLKDYAVVSQAYHPSSQPVQYAELPIVVSLRTGATVTGAEIILRRPNGFEAHLLVNSAPVRDSYGEIVSAVAVFFDVTPLAEEERLRSEFVISAAHEFRNPLTVIKGYAEVAMREPVVQGTSVYRELQRILDAANRVGLLAEGLMQAAQLHLPALVLHTEVVDLGELTQQAIERFNANHADEGYSVVTQTQEVQVEGDPDLLREAIGDLLLQARDAMPGGGTIDVKVSSWDGIATLAVTDHGPAIPPDRIPSLFVPYSLGSSSSNSAISPQRSLLLYLARRIVEESGGWIRAQSAPSGTSIYVTLPRLAASAAQLNQPALGAARPPGEPADSPARAPSVSGGGRP
jgi:PAS domain S-box-containing protein